MHIFSSLAQFGQMCAGECKSAAQPTYLAASGPSFIGYVDALRPKAMRAALESK
jgi:hypothetical protein